MSGFPSMRGELNADSQARPSEPRLGGSGMGPRNVRFSKHSGGSSTCVPKARLGKARQRFLIPFSYKCVWGLTHDGCPLVPTDLRVCAQCLLDLHLRASSRLKLRSSGKIYI